MKLGGIEEYIVRSIVVWGCKMHSPITVGNITLSKAVLAVKILQCLLFERKLALLVTLQEKSIWTGIGKDAVS